MTGRGPRRVTLLARLTLPALLALVAGCSSLPDTGPVRAGPQEQVGESRAPFDFSPAGPVPGAGRSEVVAGFLLALQASPASIEVSEQFLTSDARSAWRPSDRTLVYAAARPTVTASGVRLRLDTYVELDRQGRWLVPTMGRTRTLRLRLVREDGEWRIANPPDATVVPKQHFDLRYRRFELAFFDPGGGILVPEPVYLPWGVQAPSQLVERLLQGVPPGLRGVERSYFPPGTAVDLSVPVTADGTARVPLTPGVLELDRDAKERAVAQLAYTLGQVPGVRRIQVTVGGSPLDLPGSDTVDLGDRSPFDPSVPTASASLFALRGQAMVEIADGQELPLADPVPGAPLRSFAVDMTGGRVAAVAAGGGSVTVVPQVRAQDAEPGTSYSGTDLARPSWDGMGRLWLVDRPAGRARVLVGTPAGPVPLAAPALTGLDVRAFRVSRDGSRFAALVTGPDAGTTRDSGLLVARVVRDQDGTPVRLVRAVRLPAYGADGAGATDGADGADGGRGSTDVDLAWRSPVSLVLLTRPPEGGTGIVTRSADGGRLEGEDPPSDTAVERGVAVAARPGTGVGVVVSTRGRELLALSGGGSWTVLPVERGVTAATFAG